MPKCKSNETQEINAIKLSNSQIKHNKEMSKNKIEFLRACKFDKVHEYYKHELSLAWRKLDEIENKISKALANRNINGK